MINDDDDDDGYVGVYIAKTRTRIYTFIRQYIGNDASSRKRDNDDYLKRIDSSTCWYLYIYVCVLVLNSSSTTTTTTLQVCLHNYRNFKPTRLK